MEVIGKLGEITEMQHLVWQILYAVRLTKGELVSAIGLEPTSHHVKVVSRTNLSFNEIELKQYIGTDLPPLTCRWFQKLKARILLCDALHLNQSNNHKTIVRLGGAVVV